VFLPLLAPSVLCPPTPQLDAICLFFSVPLLNTGAFPDFLPIVVPSPQRDSMGAGGDPPTGLVGFLWVVVSFLGGLVFFLGWCFCGVGGFFFFVWFVWVWGFLVGWFGFLLFFVVVPFFFFFFFFVFFFFVFGGVFVCWFGGSQSAFPM